jgi:hypothetical protein
MAQGTRKKRVGRPRGSTSDVQAALTRPEWTDEPVAAAHNKFAVRTPKDLCDLAELSGLLIQKTLFGDIGEKRAEVIAKIIKQSEELFEKAASPLMDRDMSDEELLEQLYEQVRILENKINRGGEKNAVQKGKEVPAEEIKPAGDNIFDSINAMVEAEVANG